MARKNSQTEEMLPLLKRHEIQVLLRAGHSQSDVSARTGTSLDTVRRVKREADVSNVDDAAERKERKIGRPSKASPFIERVKQWLAEDPDLPTQELLRRAVEAGYVARFGLQVFITLTAPMRVTLRARTARHCFFLRVMCRRLFHPANGEFEHPQLVAVLLSSNREAPRTTDRGGRRLLRLRRGAA